ncbi:cytochrome c3 family protein [Roseomonas genomospecies 6]|uniref:Cytochrome C n=1 Tax=Roseomonas genomospecies 6 TaxID=214106 RepID=A0A9W7KSM4_9PROT|nr:cytochrome c3 family protein [Roseomonas genomospecies 6]KAA0677923.1 cytochrome C [Roseomonas genomospecies 6]
MTQLFRPGANRALGAVFAAAALAFVLTIVAGLIIVRSGPFWNVGSSIPQPVPFSHAVHAGELGMDCRYCHSGVETAATAGIPAVETCMGCHSQVWTAASALAPLQASAATGEPLAWNRVHRLPDHVRFHHGIHVASGVGCATCHGDVARMAEVRKVESMSMSWCLDCHRDPHGRLPSVTVPPDRLAQLEDCSICHY